MRGVAVALVAIAATFVHAGPVEVYREGPELCPRDVPRTAPVLTEPAVPTTRNGLAPPRRSLSI